jgi:negative regulator of sigma-B (phosphoserine phosphatase)
MIAVIDALGHGPKAAAVARRALEGLSAFPVDGGVVDVIRRLHDHLRGTRGAAGTVCVLRGSKLEGVGIGNVDLRVVGVRLSVALTPGVLGGSMSKPFLFGGDVGPGTRLVLFTDGISSRLDLGAVQGLAPAAACRAVMERSRHAHDDATIVVADVESVG